MTRRDYHRRNDLARLSDAAKDLPVRLTDEGAGRGYAVWPAGEFAPIPLIVARHEVVAAYLQGWKDAIDANGGAVVAVAAPPRGHDHNGECLDCDEHFGNCEAPCRCLCTVELLTEYGSRALSLLEAVEWVRATGGRHFVCPFCRAVSERDDGPGHTDACEGEALRRAGNELRLLGRFR